MASLLDLLTERAELLIPLALGLLLAAVFVFAVRAAHFKRELERSRDAADEERKSGQALAQELKESIRSLQRESRELSDINFKLPSLMKQLTVDLERRSLGPLILKVIDQIFTPTQALVFFADDAEEKLTLVAEKGLDGGPLHRGAHIMVGDGRIGFAARKQISMGPRDFRLESNLNREQIQRTECPGIEADICAPLVSNNRLLGAICMGLPRGWASLEVKRLFGMVADVAALALASNLQYRCIQQLANSDPLTGISNKAYYMKRASSILGDAKRFGRKAAVIILDVDHFKRFNDTFGHLAGDRVLRGIGDILKQHVREGDIAARFGGEEFVVLLTEADRSTAAQVAERIRMAVEQSAFGGLVKGPEDAVTLSGGVSVFPDDGTQLEDLIERADIALYRAKDAGRNSILHYGDADRDGTTPDVAGAEPDGTEEDGADDLDDEVPVEVDMGSLGASGIQAEVIVRALSGEGPASLEDTGAFFIEPLLSPEELVEEEMERDRRAEEVLLPPRE
jgi:diguanylate cyclase (GGDEF)-like protein